MANQQTELKLLKYIEQDCTLTAEQLASLCGMEPEEVKSEIKRLEEDHVILGYKAIVNWDDTIDETVTALIEDGMLEKQIMFPAALYGEMLWDPNQDLKELMADVAQRNYVHFE